MKLDICRYIVQLNFFFEDIKTLNFLHYYLILTSKYLLGNLNATRFVKVQKTNNLQIQ